VNREAAEAALLAGSPLLRTITRDGVVFSIDATVIAEAQARSLIREMRLVPGKDSLFPNEEPQTWRAPTWQSA
jgi:hypothetical protein